MAKKTRSCEEWALSVDLSLRAYSLLLLAGIKTLDDLILKSERQLVRAGFDSKSVKEIKGSLNKKRIRHK